MKKRFPDAYVTLFLIIIAVSLLSYIIPSGAYEKVYDSAMDMTFSVPGSFRYVDKQFLTPFDLLKAIPKGLIGASDIIIFVLVTGGAFGIIDATGSLNRLMKGMLYRYSNRPYRLLIATMLAFSIAGTTLGTAEEALPLYPLMIAVIVGLGFDALTGVAVILLGAGAGFVAGIFNPFTVGIAQTISELPLFSGLWMRSIAFVVFVGTALIYILIYAKKIRVVPQESSESRAEPCNRRDYIVLGILSIFLIFLIVGVLRYKFYIVELITSFLVLSIIIGAICRLHPNFMVTAFIKGASGILYGALIIGLARGIYEVLIVTQTLDTIVYGLSEGLKFLPERLYVIGMFISQSIINLFITSGSGQATMTMPIMSQVSDLLGISRQSAVLAFQFGDGFSNVISPTSGYFMAALALGRISYKKWFQWMLPLFVIWCIEGCALLLLSLVM